MADNKIKVTWDDLTDPKVDEKLRERAHIPAVNHPVKGPGTAPAAAPAGTGSVWLNTLFYMTLFGLLGGVSAWLFGEIRFLIKPHETSFALGFLYFSSIGVTLAVFLSMAEPVVSRNWNLAIINGAVAALLGLAAGFVLAIFINKLYWALGGGRHAAGTGLPVEQVIARSLGWGVLGLFMALAPGIVMRNVKKTGIGLIGGAVGGMIGGMLFDPIGAVVHHAVISRFISVTAIGALSGAGIGLIENALKTGWLQVAAGPMTGKQFILYRERTLIGSSPQCDIFLFKDPHISPTHAAIHMLPGGYTLEHAGQGATYVNDEMIWKRRLKTNDRIQIGGVVLVFQERAGDK